MKNWKQNVFFGMVAIIAFVFAFVGCDDKPNDDNEKTYTVTVGTLTNNGGSTIVAEPSSGKAGTEITLMINETYSYQLKAGTLKYGTTAISEVTGKFNLPAQNVIITAEFISSLFGTWYNELSSDVITFFENNTWAWGSTGYLVEPVTRYMWKGTWIPNGYSVILTETHIRNDNAYVTVNEITDVVADPRNFTCKFLPDRTIEIDWGNDTKEGFNLNHCQCDPKEHYLPCDCEVAGTDKCTCVVISRGFFGEIPIYQTASVSNEDAVSATTKIQNAWDYLNPSTKEYISGNVTKIEIVTGSDVVINSGIIKIGANASLSVIAETLDDLVDELLLPIATILYDGNEIAQNGLVDAGEVTVGQSKNITIVIKNAGTKILTISQSDIVIIGEGGGISTEFTKITNPGMNVAVGGQSQFMIQFTPSKTGEHNSTLNIPTNDNNRNPVVVLLKGTGID